MTRDQTRNATMSGGGRIRRQNHQGDRYGLGVWLDGAANSGDEPRVISHHGSSGFRAFINFEEGTSGGLPHQAQAADPSAGCAGASSRSSRSPRP